jgi:hypothetical protein
LYSSNRQHRSRWAAALAILVVFLGFGPRTVGAQESAPAAFDGERALELVVTQCELGSREPGSPGNRRLRELIGEMARDRGFAVWNHCFAAVSPLTGAEVELCNVVVSIGPAGGKRWWLGAHYDTRPVSDRDPDAARRSEPLVGANDGASGVAVLLHLMEVLAVEPPAAGVDLIFFDGEDSGTSGDPLGFCLGSRQLAAVCRDFGNPLAQGEPRGLIVVDMVGEAGLAIPREAYSQTYAPALTSRVFARAAELGLDVLVDEPGPAVYDDHVPFLQQGIPAVDLIDFDFPHWHTTGDTPAVCSARSLGQVGRLLLDLIHRP